MAPPYHEYEYFQGKETYPFRADAEQFDFVNAWWLIESATLAYAEEEFVRPRFLSAGFSEVRYFTGNGTDCFVAHNDACIVVAFRGTETRRRSGVQDLQNIIVDIKTDCDILLIDDPHHHGKVHKGFLAALEQIWEELAQYLTSIHQAPRTLWMTGHSLGAALATLAADRYKQVQGLYTFGSPRVGNPEFKKHFRVRAFRVVNNGDLVTTVPPTGFYEHVGELWYINSEGQMRKNCRRSEMWTDGFRGEVQNVVDSLEHMKQGSFNFIPGGLKDHVPTRYAVHLWNNLLEQK
jgi:hypothetical protein